MKLNNSSAILRVMFSSTILLAVLLQCSHSLPAPVPAAGTLDKAEILEIVPLNDQETTDEMAAQLSERNKRTIGMLRQMFPALSEIQTAAADNNDNSLTAAESENNEVRVAFEEQDSQQNDQLTDDDQDASASGGNGAPAPIDDIDNVNIDGEERDKRHFGFGFGGDASASAGGSGGGSGNFLFDIIRLVAGSGTSEGADEAAHSVDGGAKSVDPSYQEAIPGPVTRLFVIANRGISNLVQDLILRLAQTSERIVNFKARLITSLI